MRSRAIKFIYYPFLGLLYFTILLACIEAGFRITETSGVGFLQYDDKLIWRMNANEHEERLVDGQPFRITFNSQGFRGVDHDLEKAPGVKRILLLGDSYAAGLSHSDEKIFPVLLEAGLNTGDQKIEVINTGVAAWGIDQQYIYLTESGFQYEPDYVLLVASPNDVREGYCKKLITLAEGEPGFEVDRPWFPRSYRLAWFGASNSYLFQYLKLKYFKNNAWGAIWELYWYYPVNFGVVDSSNWDTPLFVKQEFPELTKAKLLYRKLLSSMKKGCDQRNIKMMVTVLPTKMEFDGTLKDTLFVPGIISHDIKELCSELDIPFLDMYEIHKNSPLDPLRIYIKEEFHLNQSGHAFVSELLLAFVKKNL